MNTPNRETESSIEEQANNLLKELRGLDKDAQVDANEQMECALQSPNNADLPLCLRGVSREVVLHARQKMLLNMSAGQVN